MFQQYSNRLKSYVHEQQCHSHTNIVIFIIKKLSKFVNTMMYSPTASLILNTLVLISVIH